MTHSTAADIHAMLRPMDTPTIERVLLIAKAVLELRNSESAVSEAMGRRTSAVMGLSATITNLDKQQRAEHLHERLHAAHKGPWPTPKSAGEVLTEHVLNRQTKVEVEPDPDVWFAHKLEEKAQASAKRKRQVAAYVSKRRVKPITKGKA